GAAPIPGRAPGGPWQVLARVDHPDAAAANAEARHETANGATGLSLAFAGAVGSYGYGIEPSAEAFARVFENIDTSVLAVELDIGWHKDIARLFAEIAVNGAISSARAFRFGLDPIGTMATVGSSPSPWAETAVSFATVVADLKRRGFVGPFAVADARPVHDAGGSE